MVVQKQRSDETSGKSEFREDNKYAKKKKEEVNIHVYKITVDLTCPWKVQKFNFTCTVF